MKRNQIAIDEGEDVIEMITHYAEQQGYRHTGYRFSGPSFKDEGSYMTNQGYPLGTTVWYVLVQLDGYRDYAFGETFQAAAWAAHETIRSRMETPE